MNGLIESKLVIVFVNSKSSQQSGFIVQRLSLIIPLTQYHSDRITAI